jgi:hypothetical protein
MTVQEIKINETRGIIQFGTAVISGVRVEFCYNYREDKFTAIAYDQYKANGIFPEHTGRTQGYSVGRAISKALRCK